LLLSRADAERLANTEKAHAQEQSVSATSR
jgi:hypothetical protein